MLKNSVVELIPKNHGDHLSFVGGVSYNYTPYFEKHRTDLFNRRKQAGKDFTDHLEMAILVAVRMAEGSGILYGLSMLRKNKHCSVCQVVLSTNIEHEPVYIRAKRVNRACSYSSTLGFAFDWIQEKADYAYELGPFEWLSGPLLICAGCLKKMRWCEHQNQLEKLQAAITKNDMKQLPDIFVLYSSLEKSLRLAEFFESQVASLLKDPSANSRSLEELKRCISNCCDSIELIGRQIFALETTSKRKLELQQNIYQYCIQVTIKLQCLFNTDSAKRDDSVTNISYTQRSNENTGIVRSMLGGLCLQFLYPIHNEGAGDAIP